MFIEDKKIMSKKNIKNYMKTSIPNYFLILIVAIIYILLIYIFGVHKSILETIDLIKYLILTPLLLCAFMVDLKIQIIPNRLNLLIFEIGLISMFAYGFFYISLTINMILGMIVGGAIFLLITLIGGAIAGKEAMGLGDVKLMGALGLCFGLTNIIVISVMSFLIGAIISIGLMICKSKKTSEYIPFGPFIVVATFIDIFVPFQVLFNILMKVFSLGLFN